MAKAKERTKAAIVKRLSEVRIVEIACKSVGISRSTYYRWLQEDKTFSIYCEDAIRLGTDTISDLAESQIVSKIKAGDFRAAVYWLEHHSRDYKPRSKYPAEEVDHFKEMSDEEFELISRSVEALRKARDDTKKV
ncbi:MAG: helix-turn-helix domain containing protein [Patescibacteria group bacterium]|nr:helix-turn-helix domain containing protein [Patescibacteria group bacterium]